MELVYQGERGEGKFIGIFLENCNNKTISGTKLFAFTNPLLSRHFCSFVSRPSPRSRPEGRKRRNVLSFEWKRSKHKMPLNSRLLSWWTSQGKGGRERGGKAKANSSRGLNTSGCLDSIPPLWSHLTIWLDCQGIFLP